MCWKHLKRFLAVLALVCSPVICVRLASQPHIYAQDVQDAQAVSRVTISGTTKTPDGTPIPGATLTIVQPDTGQTYVTWSDEKGDFDLRSIPVGHYRIEASQLGFESAKAEFDLSTDKATTVPIALKIATLEAINAANQPPAATPATTPATGANQPPTQPPSQPATPGAPAAVPTNAQAQNQSGARGGTGSQTGGRGRGFRSVNVQGQGGAAGDQSAADSQDASGLGQAASADAGVVIQGSTGQGQSNFGFGSFGDFGNMSQTGGGVANASQGGGQQPGQTGDASGGAPGMVLIGPGGGGGRGPGGGGAGGGGRGGAGGARGGRGGRAGQNGQDTPWGLQRVMRQRINSYHFSVFDKFEDSAFDARPYSLTQVNPTKESFFKESFGGNIGGPLRIPHLYDGRDKTFVFLNVTGTRNENAVDSFGTVPTSDEVSGNFCNIGIPLFDPTSNFSGPRTALPCNISSMINPAAAGLLSFFPAPNVANTINGAQNFHLQTTTPSNAFSVNLHVLHAINSKLNVQATYNITQTSSQSVNGFPELTGSSSGRGQSLSFGATENITTRLNNNTTLQFTRQRTLGLNQFSGDTDIAATLGIDGVSTAPFDWNLPGIAFPGFSSLNDPLASLRRNQTTRLSDGVTYALPKHTIKVGGELRRVDFNNFADPTPEGTYTFTGALSEQLYNEGGNWVPLCNAPGTTTLTSQQCSAYQFADFLLGVPENANVRFSGQPTYLASWGWVGYATDDWHVNQHLTFTYGLRYEGITPPSELHGSMADLVLNPTFTEGAVVTAGGTSPFGGTLPQGVLHGDYKDFSPRVGLAWRVPGKFFEGKHTMVVRSGYGIFYSPTIYNTLANDLLDQPPFGTAQTAASTTGQLLTLQNGFPTSTVSGAITNTIAIDPNYTNAYAQIWNLGIETQISPSWLVTMTYTGTKGTHLELLSAPNQLPPGVTGAPLLVSNVTGGFTYESSGASSILNALQARVQRRMHNGMMFQLIYTYSKSIDDSSNIGGSGGTTVVQQFPFFSLERGLSAFDERHVITGNYYYELPFGERKKWLRSRWESAVFGNWRVNGTVSFHTGTPFTAQYNPGTADFSGSGGGFSYRPDQVADPNLSGSQKTLTEFFNTAAFLAPANGVFGDAGRNTITGPDYFVLNASVSRSIQVGHDGNHRVDFRWDMVNLTNTPSFTSLGTILGSQTFGQITGAGPMRSMSLTLRYNF